MKKSIFKSAKSLWKMLPMIFGAIMLVALANALIPKSFYTSFLSEKSFIDPIITALVGSISAGTPVVSYIISGELLNQGVGLIAVTAFLLAWVTVGIIQIPAESITLGRKFTFLRNISSFVLAILIAIIVGIFLT